MVPESSVAPSPRRRQGLLWRDTVELGERKDCGRYEIYPIEEPLSFEEGFWSVIRACKLLSQTNDGVILVGVAGPPGAGKSVFAEKLQTFMPSAAIISMNSYNDATRLIDGSFDDQRLTDYDELLYNLHGLKGGESVQVPIYDLKSNSRVGYRTLEVPSSRVVILEGIYALSEKLRPLLDLRVSLTGGVPLDLVRRVSRDTQGPGQEREESIHLIFDTLYPTYKSLIEPDLETAHIKILNEFNHFNGFQNLTSFLKSTKAVTPEQMKAVLSENFKERTEEICDIYLLPTGEDPQTCRSFLRMRNRAGKYYLSFEEWITDPPFIVSPRITFEVNVRILGGLMVLGYTVAAVLKRKSHIFDDGKVTVKTDCFEQLNRTYVQVQGRDRTFVNNVANQLGLEASSYVPHTYIEQMQLEKLVKKDVALPGELMTKLSLIPPKGALSRAAADNRMRYLQRAPALPDRLPYQGVITQLSDQVATVNERMDEFGSRVEEFNSNIPNRTAASGSLLSLPSSSSQLGRESPQIEQVKLLADNQHQIMLRMDTLSNLLQEYVGERSRLTQRVESSTTQKLGSSTVPVLVALAIGCIGTLAYSLKKSL